MVRAILADHNLQGHLQVLFTVINGDETWREMWQELNLSLANFRDLGLAPEAADALLWQVCQQSVEHRPFARHRPTVPALTPSDAEQKWAGIILRQVDKMSTQGLRFIQEKWAAAAR